MNFVSAVGIVPHYFEKRKPAAYAATGLGTGVGMVAFPYMLTAMLQSYGYKLTMLYLTPLSLTAITAPIVFKPQIKREKLKSAVNHLKGFLSPFKLFATPFYLLNAYFWNGGHASLSILLFSHIVRHSGAGGDGISVATLSLSLMGAGFMTATIALLTYLIKFSMNHYILQISANLILAAVSFIFAFVSDDTVFYVNSFFAGLAYGIVISNMVCLSAHLYPTRHVESSFSFQEAVSGISGLIVPVTAGVIQKSYGDAAGMCYIAAHGLMAALILILPALFRRSMWTAVTDNSTSSVNNCYTETENTDADCADKKSDSYKNDSKLNTEYSENTTNEAYQSDSL